MTHPTLQQIALAFQSEGIESFFVGGCVRDHFLGIDSDDIDICLVGVTKIESVAPTLKKFATSLACEVGNAFPVFIADIEGIGKVDFALARTESKSGKTRKEFEVSTHGVGIEADLRRRDLTVNAIAVNVLTGDIIDPFGGLQDLRSGIAREVSEAFAEDTLRVFRAARFCARFGLTPTDSLVAICKELAPDDISNERVGMEFLKAMKQAEKPSTFFRFLDKVGFLHCHFGELADLIGIGQDPIHHPEGDAFEHTMQTLDQAKDAFTRTVMVCHDLGKATTTGLNRKGRISAIGHEDAGVPLAKAMLGRISAFDKKAVSKVCALIELHMVHTKAVSEKGVRKTLRKLIKAGLEFDQLVEVCRCDVSGRGSLPKFTPNIGQDIAKGLIEDGAMVPIVTGNVLRSIGIPQGPLMGRMIAKGLELQDRGTLNKANFITILKGIQEFRGAFKD